MKEQLRELLRYTILMEVQPDSGPGVPFAAFGATNRDVIESEFELLADAAVEYVMLLSVIHPDEFASYTAQELCERGLNFPARLFVKNEPHKLKKVLEKRWRLICSLALLVQLAQRVTDGPQNKAEIANWKTCPSAPGQNKSTEQETLDFFSRVARFRARVDTDMNGWDWSVQEWELWADAAVRLRLYDARPGTMIFNLVLNTARACMNGVVALSDGTLLAQVRPFAMKSGSYDTSSSNSRIRVFLSRMINPPSLDCVAYGDDAVEDTVLTPHELALEYAKYGKVVKEAHVTSGLEPFEFCSTLFGPYSAVPMGWRKALFSFLRSDDISNPIRQQALAQMLYEYRHGGTIDDTATQAEILEIVTTVYGSLYELKRQEEEQSL